MTAPEQLPVKKRGRPKKSDIAAAKLPRGRPRGDNYAIEEFKQRLLNSPRSQKVFDSIMNAALDDNHKNQAAAWKLLADRLLPLSYFEKDKLGGGKPSVNITISGLGGDISIDGNSQSDIIDAEDIDYEE